MDINQIRNLHSLKLWEPEINIEYDGDMEEYYAEEDVNKVAKFISDPANTVIPTKFDGQIDTYSTVLDVELSNGDKVNVDVLYHPYDHDSRSKGKGPKSRSTMYIELANGKSREFVMNEFTEGSADNWGRSLDNYGSILIATLKLYQRYVKFVGQ